MAYSRITGTRNGVGAIDYARGKGKVNISHYEGYRYAFQIHQYAKGIHLPFVVRDDTQSGASVSMTRACACAIAHH